MINTIKKITFALVALIFIGCSVNRNIVFDDENDLYSFLLNKAGHQTILFKQEKIPSYFEGFSTSNSEDSIRLKKITLSQKYKIDLFTYKYVPDNYDKYHNEYIKIKGHKFFIDSLLRDNNNEMVEKAPYIAFTSINTFNYNKYSYVLLEGENRLFYRDGNIKSYLLLQFLEEALYNIWLFYNGGNSNLVFNDFNGDNTLDYLEWKPQNKRINIFHLRDDKFIKDSLHYLIVEPSNKQKTESNLIWNLKLNKQKSIWYKKL